MGNRAVITTEKNFNNNGIGIYLHWNGGRDSVEAFLKYCELRGYREPTSDNYGWARLAQVIGNFFGGTTSIGMDTVNHLDCDNYDNGVYLIQGWQIVGRKYFDDREEQNEYPLVDMVLSIDSKQPKDEQMGPEAICEKLGVEVPEDWKQEEEPAQEVQPVIKARYKLNDQFKGIEIYFECKPCDDIRSELKAAGFRWHRANKCWYAKQTEDNIKLAQKLTSQK